MIKAPYVSASTERKIDGETGWRSALCWERSFRLRHSANTVIISKGHVASGLATSSLDMLGQNRHQRTPRKCFGSSGVGLGLLWRVHGRPSNGLTLPSVDSWWLAVVWNGPVGVAGGGMDLWVWLGVE